MNGIGRFRQWSMKMNGYEALALAVKLTNDGIDPNEATEIALETMEAANDEGIDVLEVAA